MASAPTMERRRHDALAGHVEPEVDNFNRKGARLQGPVQGEHRGIVAIIGGNSCQYSQRFIFHGRTRSKR